MCMDRTVLIEDGKKDIPMGSVKKQLRFIYEWEEVCKAIKQVIKKDIPIVPKL